MENSLFRDNIISLFSIVPEITTLQYLSLYNSSTLIYKL